MSIPTLLPIKIYVHLHTEEDALRKGNKTDKKGGRPEKAQSHCSSLLPLYHLFHLKVNTKKNYQFFFSSPKRVALDSSVIHEHRTWEVSTSVVLSYRGPHSVLSFLLRNNVVVVARRSNE